MKKKNKLLKILILVFVLGLSGCFQKKENPNNVVDNTEHTNENQNNQENNIDNPDDPDNNIDDPDNIENPDNNEVTVAPNGNTDTPSISSGVITNDSRNNNELKNYWSSIDKIAEAAQNFYSEYFTKTRLITKDGFLYNKASDEIIDINYLCTHEGFDSSFMNYDCDILLLDASDVRAYSEISLKTEKGLTVFVSVKHPTENSYLLTSSKSKGGIISTTKYISLLSKYSQNHGSIRSLYSDSETYQKILSYIGLYESKYENYFVRSLYMDDKYASVILSPQSNVMDVKHYILQKDGSLWKVVMSGLESESRLMVQVNKALPDFNLGMLPNYSIYDFRHSIKTDYTDLRNAMFSLSMISSSNDILYMYGTEKYCYVVLNNQLKYLCINENGNWTFKQIYRFDEAINYLIKNESMPPTFIVWAN